jgi:hypothetical protein
MSSSRARKYTALYGTSCQCRPACKSCPYTQRFRYNVGQQAHWSWINTTNEPHALRCVVSITGLTPSIWGGKSGSYSFHGVLSDLSPSSLVVV